VKLANFEYFSITRGKNNHTARNTKMLKIC
jgi:hypothetical protein